MKTNHTIKGLILCGGQSSRMGKDKALLQYHDLPQAFYGFEILENFCSEVYLSCREDQSGLSNPMYSALFDKAAYSRTGPLGALLSAWAEKPDANWLVMGCDYPLLKAADWQFFLDELKDMDAPAGFYKQEEQLFEPTLAYYPAGSYPKVLSRFQSGNHSLQSFLQDEKAFQVIPKDAVVLQSIDTLPEFEKMKAAGTGIAAVARVDIHRYRNNAVKAAVDVVAAEEPLEIQLEYGAGAERQRKSISVTMRTPGQDQNLAAGFLFTEGILQQAAAIETMNCDGNYTLISLKAEAIPRLPQSDRNFYTSSSCGLCGKASIDAIQTVSAFKEVKDNIRVPASILATIPDQLKRVQDLFQCTGGIHAAALFNARGEFLTMFEDVGRHNALDKLIGFYFLKEELPLNSHILLLSGRASFELVQKAQMAGIRMIAAIGAPSSLAVQAAKEWGITLVGFLKEGKFNIYTAGNRIN